MHVLYLERTVFDFYTSGTESVLRFDFSPVAGNLEISNKEELTTQIKAFLDANKITPANLAIVLSENTIFAKNIPEGNGRDEAVKIFLDSIPFDHVASRSYPIQGGVLAIGTNHDFYSVFKDAFSKYGYSCDVVVPVFVTGVTTLNPQSGLDLTSAKILASSYESLKPHTIDQHTEIKPVPQVVHHEESRHVSSSSQQPPKKINTRAFILAGVFGVLILILVFMLLQNANTPPPKKRPTPTPQAAAVVAHVQSHAHVLAAETTAQLSVIIQSDSTTESEESSLSAALKAVGMSVSQESLQSSLQNTTIFFAPTVSEEDKAKIIAVVSSSSQTVLVQEVKPLPVDAEITLSHAH